MKKKMSNKDMIKLLEKLPDDVRFFISDGSYSQKELTVKRVWWSKNITQIVFEIK